MNRTLFPFGNLRFLALLLAVAAPLAHAQRMPVTTASDDARAHFEQGRARMAHADFAAARVHLDAALAADPAFGLAHLYRAVAAPAAEREGHMRQAAAARVSDGERQVIEAYAAHLRGDHDAELAALTAAAERFPADPWLPFQLGNELMTLDRYDEAAAAFGRTAAADPGFAGAYNLLGYNELRRGDAAAAERAFQEYVRMAPDEANPYDSYGEFLMLNGRLDEAEAQFEQALARDPEFTVSRDNLVRIAVTRAFQGYVAAINRHDAEAYAAFYTAGAVMSPPDGSQIVGRPAIHEGAVRSFAPGRNEVQAYETQEITPMGDGFAYHRATISTRIDGGSPDEGIDTFIWVMTPDGWQIASDTWTSNAATTAASND